MPFEVVNEDRPAPLVEQRANEAAAASILLTLMSTFAKRTVIALESCFTLITVGLVFWASLSILAAPNTNQLIGLGIFSVFVLIANWLVLKKRL